jgi:sorbitol-specific phosphotransferase system component IIBC
MIAVFTANLSAESLNVKSATEQSDRKPNKKKKKKSHKKNRKAKSHAKKNGLVGRGCRGLGAMPGRR